MQRHIISGDMRREPAVFQEGNIVSLMVHVRGDVLVRQMFHHRNITFKASRLLPGSVNHLLAATLYLTMKQ